MTTASVLDKTFPHSTVIDLLRVTAIVLTVVALTLAWRIVIQKKLPYDTLMMSAMTCYWIFAVLQELQQVGKPFVWWRLPLLLLADLLELASVLRRIDDIASHDERRRESG